MIAGPKQQTFNVPKVQQSGQNLVIRKNQGLFKLYPPGQVKKVNFNNQGTRIESALQIGCPAGSRSHGDDTLHHVHATKSGSTATIHRISISFITTYQSLGNIILTLDIH